jgi:hypothetical protein
MSLTFHIIYTPETVKPLLPLLYSLLKWSDCHFRLVANGCSAGEQATLQHLCADQARLTYMALPTTQVMVHGHALNYLQTQNQEPYFCFMDSDIYAIDAFLPTFLPQLADRAALFSGMSLRFPPTGLVAPKDKDFLAGPFTYTAGQLCVGTTFFAIYHNETLTQLREATGIGFTKYRWRAIPPAYQEQLVHIGAHYQQYDTAKLLNLLLHLHGHQLHYQPCAVLRHIEGVSRFAVIRRRSWWAAVRAWGGRWRRRLAGQQVNRGYDEALPYLSCLLLALANEQQLPSPPPLPDAAHQAWVAAARSELVALHAEFVQNGARSIGKGSHVVDL